MYSDFIASVLQHSTIGVVSHIRPDGDAIGSQVALSLWLQSHGKNVVALNEDADSIPSNLTWLTEFFPVHRFDSYKCSTLDALIFVDGNAAHRFGEEAKELFKQDIPRYLIDHHPDPDEGFLYPISKVSACSTAELIFSVVASDSLDRLTAEMAKAIYTGLVTDTGSFRFDSVHADVHRIVGELLERGQFAPPEVHEKIYDQKDAHQLQLLGMALNSIETRLNGSIAFISITDEMFQISKCTYADTEGFVAYPMSVRGTIGAVLFAEIEGRVKLSIRSKRSLDCNQLARKFGGGGHVRASGAWFEGTLSHAHTELEQAIRVQLEQ